MLIDSTRASLWWAAWRSFGAGYLTLQVWMLLHVWLFCGSEPLLRGSELWQAVGVGAVTGAPILTALQATRPPSWRWAATAALVGLILSAALVTWEIASPSAFWRALWPSVALPTIVLWAIGWAAAGSLTLPRPSPVWRLALASAAGLACGTMGSVVAALLIRIDGGEAWVHLLLYGLTMIMAAMAGYYGVALVWRRREMRAR